MKKIPSIIGLATIGLLCPSVVYAQDTFSTELGEVSNFGELISIIWSFGSNIIIALAVFFVVLGAFFYVLSAGNENRIDQGKQMIFGSLIAILIVLTSGILIRLLHKPASGTRGALADIPEVIVNATNILIGIIGTFTVLMLVYAGVMYMTSHGNSKNIKKAHKAFQYSIYGLTIGVLAFIIVNTIIKILV
ncbi:hypothetical protein JW758_01285 [Candidatus Peregrinibacteria bacterium]|nr:hypothetical protein [Candidatus Peregrinibacteria bacterium]